MNQPQSNSGTVIGTIGGTLLSVFASVQAGDIVKTIVLAVIGAVTSFGISLTCRWLVKFSRKSKT